MRHADIAAFATPYHAADFIITLLRLLYAAITFDAISVLQRHNNADLRHASHA